MATLRGTAVSAAVTWLRTRTARRYGVDGLPMVVERRRIYIVPSRFGVMLSLLLVAMLIAGLNYSSNLGLAFAFLLASMALVAMHHCNRNLLGLSIDADTQIDAFAGHDAQCEFVIRNESGVDRCDVEIHCAKGAMASTTIAARTYEPVIVRVPDLPRGITRLTQFELRTRYPFGWFRAWTYVQATVTVYVAPRPDGDRALPAAGAAAGSSSSTELSGDEDFSGLRAYAPGMSLKHMAWKVLARGGEAAVRSYSGLAAQPEWLAWTMLEGLDDAARLSQLCRWILESDAAQRSYGLRLPDVQIAPGRGPLHRTTCLRALAAYGTADTAP